MEIIENINLSIPRQIGMSFIEKILGGKINPGIEKIIHEKKDLCISSIEPRAVYDYFQIQEVIDDKVFFTSGNVFEGPNISKILKGSESAGIFICTLGQKIDEIIGDANSAGHLLEAIIMDSITTEILVILGDYTGTILKKKGLSIPGWGSTCSYSPGQYKWTIHEQKKLFEMIDGTKIGVILNSSYLMIPFKSISSVYGFGPMESINKTRVACDLCPRQDCISRR